MTWSVQDPSLSHATARPIRNIVGYPGAIGADLLMQILGLGAIMLILPLAARGWRMLTHRSFDRQALRLGCWILCTVIAAGFASCWPRNGAWPLPTQQRRTESRILIAERSSDLSNVRARPMFKEGGAWTSCACCWWRIRSPTVSC